MLVTGITVSTLAFDPRPTVLTCQFLFALLRALAKRLGHLLRKTSAPFYGTQ